MSHDPATPILSQKVCELCISTVKVGAGLIRDGKIDAGLNHLDQLVMHIEKWQGELKDAAESETMEVHDHDFDPDLMGKGSGV